MNLCSEFSFKYTGDRHAHVKFSTRSCNLQPPQTNNPIIFSHPYTSNVLFSLFNKACKEIDADLCEHKKQMRSNHKIT